MKVIDVEVRNEGTLWTFQCNTSDAQEWVQEHVEVPSYMNILSNGIRTFACEHRFAPAIVEGMREAGLEVECG